MPAFEFETKVVGQIADEFEKLAKALRAWPKGQSTSSRGTGPSQRILASLQKVNAALARGAQDRTLGASSFADIGREFESIGAALREAAGGSKNP